MRFVSATTERSVDDRKKKKSMKYEDFVTVW